jgi:hypothetical protein
VYVALPHTPEYLGRIIERYRAEDVQIAKDQHAALLGSLKRGFVDRKSEAKARAARLNGLRGGRRSGRPTRPVTQLSHI